MGDTKQRLIDGTIEAIRQHGINGVSARTIAGIAGVNQALIFYHFGTVNELLAVACEATTRTRVAAYRERLAAVTSFGELLHIGREIFVEEQRLGNIRVLTQMLAGAGSGAETSASLRQPTADALRQWVEEIESVLRRLLAGSPMAELADPAGLAKAISAGFIGIQLFGGVEPDGARQALDALERLAVLVEVMDDLGPAARRVLRSRLRRAASPG